MGLQLGCDMRIPRPDEHSLARGLGWSLRVIERRQLLGRLNASVILGNWSMEANIDIFKQGLIGKASGHVEPGFPYRHHHPGTDFVESFVTVHTHGEPCPWAT